MIKVINVSSKAAVPVAAGRVRAMLNPAEDGTRVQVAIEEIDPGKTCHFSRSDRTQVVYLLEGQDATIMHASGGVAAQHSLSRRSGVYLEPGEAASITAGATPLTLFLVTVPKYTGRLTGNDSPKGYVFVEAKLQSLVDEKRFRERTFWINQETGLSDSFDLQLGRMFYAPHAYSPRHVHLPAPTSSIIPEHFYFIEKGTGEVRHDTGSLPVGPGDLVLIPSGDWHSLVSSETGFDYIEFEAPFEFVTRMDVDPLGKNWYLNGTDDGTGQPKLWVQS
ncbi:MAG: cupin domain-containing protein [Deltaproteobacteria bacterium]|nr:cupin domain-containing protein [Deltaproteobacteria bacterium]